MNEEMAVKMILYLGEDQDMQLFPQEKQIIML